MNTVQTQVAAVAAPSVVADEAPASLLDDAQTRAVVGAAVDLSNADRQFESAVVEVAKAVARVLGTEPSFALWTEVQTRFIERYSEARECKEETARGRWVKVAAVMASEYALEKPAKPTKAAETKAAQRSDAAEQAAQIIAAAKATTPAEVLALTKPKDGEPIKAPIVSALADAAKKMASEASKAANEAARAEVKALRETIRKALPTLTLAQLRKIAEMLPRDEPADPTTAEVSATLAEAAATE